MSDLRKIIAAVAVLAAVLAIFLICFEIFYLKPRLEEGQKVENTHQSRAVNADASEKTISLHSPGLEIEQSTESGPMNSEPVSSEEEPQSSSTLQDFLVEDGSGINAEAMNRLLRDHVENARPQLQLSDEEYEHLAESIIGFREANRQMHLTQRTSANAAAIRESIQKTVAAMEEFREITGMNPDEFFMGEEPPVIFGNADYPIESEGEIVTEDLSDPNP